MGKLVRKAILFFVVFMFFVGHADAAHIVGGSLTYEHNGGGNYTVRMVLWRDCADPLPGENKAQAFPDFINIDVQQVDGSEFIPSRDFTLSQFSITNVPTGLDSCDIEPDPLPCVQECVYTGTVNLPLNEKGYHLIAIKNSGNNAFCASGGLTWMCNRNARIGNLSNPAVFGAAFFAYIPGYWIEEFPQNGINNDTSFTLREDPIEEWQTEWWQTQGSTPVTRAWVNNGAFEVEGADNGSVTLTT